MNPLLKILILGVSVISLAGCNGIINSQYYEYLASTEEAPVCNKDYSYTSTVKVTGTATFYKRGINLVTQLNTSTQLPELKNLTLGDPLQTALPIKHSEIVVYNSKNAIVQCGRTNALGILKSIDGATDLLIPATPDTYSIQVLSRITSYSSFELNASVKKDKYTNKLYSLEKVSFSNGVDDLNILLTAYARQTESEEISGGAFNILNSVATAFEYVKLNTVTVDTSCLSAKANIYWKAGFNAFQYYYPEEDPSTLSSNSYYDHAGDKTLNITGGRLGNTSFENTDHFDDYVVIHEYGHFVEDHCGRLVTPGGGHVLVSRIDPQLAWSEAWSNYFAAQVMYNSINKLNPEFEGKMFSAGFTTAPAQKWSYFSSTFGFSDSHLNVGNGSGVMFDLKKSGQNPDSWQDGPYEGYTYDKVDPSRYVGEGHFREGAITRGLFKLTNSCGSTCATVPISFETVWKAMDLLNGIGSLKFKSSHGILENIRGQVGGSWGGNNQLTVQSEALHLFADGQYLNGGFYTWAPFAEPLIDQFLPCTTPTRIEPRIDDPVLAGSNSDHRYSNHYYLIDFSIMPNLNTISVKFDLVTGTATEFDLLLFKEDYIFNIDYSCSVTDALGNCKTSFIPSRTTSSDVVRGDRTSGPVGFKKITNLQALDHSKKYLLNIRAYTAGKSISATTLYNYVIRDSLTDGTGKFLCF